MERMARILTAFASAWNGGDGMLEGDYALDGIERQRSNGLE